MASDHRPSRRNLLAGAVALIAPAALAGTASAQSPAIPLVWAKQYTATKGAVSLAVYRKRLGAPKPGDKPRPTLILSHGSSVAAQATYDLSVPGAGEYSVMNVFARLGYDVWAIDFENYGKSARTAGTSDIASGAADLLALADVIERETGVTTHHFSVSRRAHCASRCSQRRTPNAPAASSLPPTTYTAPDRPRSRRAQKIWRFINRIHAGRAIKK